MVGQRGQDGGQGEEDTLTPGLSKELEIYLVFLLNPIKRANLYI